MARKTGEHVPFIFEDKIFFILGICIVILSKKNKHSKNVCTTQHCSSNVCSFVFYLFYKQLSCTIYFCIRSEVKRNRQKMNEKYKTHDTHIIKFVDEQ